MMQTILDKLLHVQVVLLITVMVVIQYHAPIAVGFGVLLPDYDLLIKSWKEILLGISTIILLFITVKRGVFTTLIRDRLLQLIALYAVIHLVLIVVYRGTTDQMLAGLLIDLRYVLLFALAYATLYLLPQKRDLILRYTSWAACGALVFAFLQATVLPVDILKYIGYGDMTIQPYLTIDKNDDFVRINGTFRGPNPLGAYMVIVLSVLAAYVLAHQALFRRFDWRVASVSALSIMSVTALWSSHSRSAWIGTLVALALVAVILIGKRIPLKMWILLITIPAIVGLGGLYAAKDTSFVQNVIVHNDPDDPVLENSNEGHIASLIDGTERAIRQPFGAGIGSTGSASLLGDAPLIIENQYLFIAHEVGWIGLAVFGAITYLVLRRLYAARADMWAVALFGSGIGLLVIGLLLPVWVDDMVSILWWGLAGVILGSARSKRGMIPRRKS